MAVSTLWFYKDLRYTMVQCSRAMAVMAWPRVRPSKKSCNV